MGSEGPAGVTVHITGFKKFHGVAENPTEKIVRNLQPFMKKRGLPKGLTLGSCTVLETAGQGGLGPLRDVFESAIVDKEYGLNDQGQVILTTLPVNEVNKSLQQMGFDVAPSDDAGRFVCNYVYYQSLRFAEQNGIKSLFVHFPLFTTISEEVQMNFVASLLEVLASLKYAQ
uniref:Pyrrolidone-carboxylate peptidase n=1 Tax=Leersia perrieri TaxID=77586 RepID=A0A0D9VUC9_9ORYZ